MKTETSIVKTTCPNTVAGRLRTACAAKLLPLLMLLAFNLSVIHEAKAAYWVNTSPMTTARIYNTATLLPSGKVLVVGGGVTGGPGGYNFHALSSAELYDPVTGTWTTTGAMNNPRIWHTATLLPNGKVLVTGGDNYNGVLSSAELYNPATGAWTTTGAMSFPRLHHTATLLPNGKVLVAGGSGPVGGDSGDWLFSAELYDPSTGTWTGTSKLNTERAWHTATLLSSGTVLVAGGYGGSPDHTLSSAELYDPATGAWTNTGSLNTGRCLHAATLLPNGQVLVAGSSASLTSTELYDPASGMWTVTGALNAGRATFPMTLLTNGKVLASGGEDSNQNAISSTELYDPASGTWTNAESLNTARWDHTSTLLPNGNVLVIGGEGENIFDHDYLSSTELYIVNFIDYAIFANYWMDDTCSDPNWCNGADFDHSGSVDMLDLATFAEYWL
ncbi:MAG: kelch repeat-containing protein [Sedimentisphaerales bacterium]